MMMSLKDIARVVDGLSLVAKEGISRRSNTFQLETVIKTAVLSVADVAGLTKGTLRTLDTQILPIDSTDHAHTNTGNVIFFTGESARDVSAHNSDAPPALDADSDARVLPKTDTASTLTASMDPDTQDSLNLIDPRTGAPSTSNATVVDGAVTPSKQRRPRERRVPSTPFSRAMG